VAATRDGNRDPRSVEAVVRHHHALTPEEQSEAMAHTLARELTAGATWDGVGELKERGHVGSAPERRALLREYGLDWARPRGPGR